MPRRQAAAEAQWGVSAKRAPVQGWIQAAAAHVDGSPSMSEMFDWYVGIDWASEVHQVCLVDDRGVVRGERAVRHSGEELAALAAWLIEGAASEHIAVAIELPHGGEPDGARLRGARHQSQAARPLPVSVSGAKDATWSEVATLATKRIVHRIVPSPLSDNRLLALGGAAAEGTA